MEISVPLSVSWIMFDSAPLEDARVIAMDGMASPLSSGTRRELAGKSRSRRLVSVPAAWCGRLERSVHHG